jgi:hypothetical protein
MLFSTGAKKAAAACFLYFFLFSLTVRAQSDFYKHVSFLASDSLHGRAPGTADEKVAAAYITSFLRNDCKASVTFQKFTYPLDSANGHSATNIVAKLNRHKKQTIILSAHYDHLGMGSSKALDFSNKKLIHPGADDNASGVVMVMELTRFLASQKDLPFNVIAFFSSAHEEGLFGSQYFVKTSVTDSLYIALVINFDMVGRLDTSGKTLRVGSFLADSAVMNFFKAHDTDTLHFRFDDSNIEFSDLKYFQPLQVPLLHFTTGTHQDYHRASDVVAKINFEGMNTIFGFMKRFLGFIEMSGR